MLSPQQTESKIAQANWKMLLKNNPAKVKENQDELIHAILKSPVPRWGGINLIVLQH